MFVVGLKVRKTSLAKHFQECKYLDRLSSETSSVQCKPTKKKGGPVVVCRPPLRCLKGGVVAKE